MAREAAIVEANHTRLRPILMTTVMLIAAMVPIALGRGPGAGARASMAKVIIGGQLLSLLLALLVTPVTYSLFDGVSGRFGWLWRWLVPSSAAPGGPHRPDATARELDPIARPHDYVQTMP
jgi:HAE1 family hydrophobic/amphiphilic exporter-1